MKAEIILSMTAKINDESVLGESYPLGLDFPATQSSEDIAEEINSYFNLFEQILITNKSAARLEDLLIDIQKMRTPK